MLKILLLSIILMAFVFIGFAIKILLEKNGTFPNIHIGQNKYLQEQGVACATSQDKVERAKVRNARLYNHKTLLDKELESL